MGDVPSRFPVTIIEFGLGTLHKRRSQSSSKPRLYSIHGTVSLLLVTEDALRPFLHQERTASEAESGFEEVIC